MSWFIYEGNILKIIKGTKLIIMIIKFIDKFMEVKNINRNKFYKSYIYLFCKRLKDLLE